MHAQSKNEPMLYKPRGFNVPAVRIKGNKNALKVASVSLAWRLDCEMRR